MRILGVDYGLKRVGLAVGEDSTGLAFPRERIEWTTRDELFAKLLAFVEAENIQRIVVGLPLLLDGGESETTRQVKNFVGRLKRRSDLEVELMDERLTSAEAEARLRETDMKRKKRDALSDSQAAACILQSWFDNARRFENARQTDNDGERPDERYD